MKIKINWKKFLLFAFVCLGLVLITNSFAVSLGILLLLFVIDGLLMRYEQSRQQKAIDKQLTDQQNTNDGETH